MFAMNLGSLVVHLNGRSASFDAMIDNAKTKMEAAQKKLQSIGNNLSLKITMPLAAMGAASVRAMGNFDDAMTKSTAIMGNVSAEMRKEMEQTALSLSEEGVTSARDLAKSYFYLASAGLDAQKSIKALPVVQKFAAAGAFDMARATDLLTDAQSAMGMTSKDAVENQQGMIRLSDALVKANTLANASVEQFSTALTTKSAASLRLLNKDLEEGLALLAAFADQGIKAEQGGEKLSIVLRDLQNASIRNADAWKEMGLRVYDANGKMLPIVDIISQLESSMKDASDEQKKMNLMMLGFQDRSVSAIQSLFGTTEKIREYERGLRAAGGTTQEVADRQLQSFNAQMKVLWNRITNVGIQIGQILLPYVRKMVSVIQSSIEYWKGLNASTKEWVVFLGILTAMAGPALIALSKFISVLTTLIKAYQVLAAVQWAALAPWAAVGAKVGAVLAFGYAIYKVTEYVAELTGFTEELADIFQTLGEKIGIFQKELSNTEAGQKMIDQWKKMRDEGKITQAEFDKRMKTLNAAVQEADRGDHVRSVQDRLAGRVASGRMSAAEYQKQMEEMNATFKAPVKKARPKVIDEFGLMAKVDTAMAAMKGDFGKTEIKSESFDRSNDSKFLATNLNRMAVTGRAASGRPDPQLAEQRKTNQGIQELIRVQRERQIAKVA